MCVIIFIPRGQQISKSELRDAWLTNPDGAGFSVQINDRVYFKRGYMNFDDFFNDIHQYIGGYNLVLHFRISTSSKVNEVQTHPYKNGNVKIKEGTTKRPVICMNGIVSKQTTYPHCNDTMSFIMDHEDTFECINQDIINILQDYTSAKWCVMKPKEVLMSSNFVEHEGRYYSNKNHLYKYRTFKSTNKVCGINNITYKRKKHSVSSLIKDKYIRDELKEDLYLYEDLEDFIDLYCNDDSYYCMYCSGKCLKDAKSIKDILETLEENFYISSYDYYDYKKKEEEKCNLLDYYYYWDENDNDIIYE